MSVIQQPLDLTGPKHLNWQDFWPGENAPVIARLQQLVAQPEPKGVFLFGPEGAGKTLLLNIMSQVWSVPYIDFKQEKWSKPYTEINSAFICFDHVDTLAGDLATQEALFHTLNQVYDQGVCPIFAAERAPKFLALELPDLVSRLQWGLALSVQPLSEQERFALLKYKASEEGMTLSDEVVRFLASRVSRDTGSLLSILSILAQSSLEQQRKITVPFVKSVLGV